MFFFLVESINEYVKVAEVAVLKPKLKFLKVLISFCTLVFLAGLQPYFLVVGLLVIEGLMYVL